MPIRNGIIEAIGNTPLIKLKRASEETGCTILGKAEFMNPGQSVKDRAALFIIEDAVKSGRLRPGGGWVAAQEAFHGRTLGALTITGQPAKRAPFEPLPGPVAFVPYGDSAALQAAVTGATAVQIDVSQRLQDALLPFGIVVVTLAVVLLLLVFRSILVPITAAIGFVLSVLAGFVGRALVRRGLRQPWVIHRINRLSDRVLDLVKRPITIAVLDEVADVLQTGHYTRNIASALNENRELPSGISPWPWVERIAWHRLVFGLRQYSHSRHSGVYSGMTWSPGWSVFTPAPTSTTTPAPSWPRMVGNNPSGSMPDSV